MTLAVFGRFWLLLADFGRFGRFRPFLTEFGRLLVVFGRLSASSRVWPFLALCWPLLGGFCRSWRFGRFWADLAVAAFGPIWLFLSVLTHFGRAWLDRAFFSRLLFGCFGPLLPLKPLRPDFDA